VSFLLDTNVVSEWVRARPDEGVVAWLANVDEDRLFVSAVTLAELRYGIERMPAGRRRVRLEQWLREELPLRFGARVLPVDAAVADRWGRLVAAREALGRPIGSIDAFIAATAQAHQLALVTRNTADFDGSVQAVVDPWASA
jgi:predicted nucleic acid-binding protein